MFTFQSQLGRGCLLLILAPNSGSEFLVFVCDRADCAEIRLETAAQHRLSFNLASSNPNLRLEGQFVSLISTLFLVEVEKLQSYQKNQYETMLTSVVNCTLIARFLPYYSVILWIQREYHISRLHDPTEALR